MERGCVADSVLMSPVRSLLLQLLSEAGRKELGKEAVDLVHSHTHPAPQAVQCTPAVLATSSLADPQGHGQATSLHLSALTAVKIHSY